MKSRERRLLEMKYHCVDMEKGHELHGLFLVMAGSTGLEPAASGVTGRRYNQLNYDPLLQQIP
jgi:hypothetical protein